MNNQIQEIRIYYETLEQAYHFVFPIIKDIAEKYKIDVKLVKINRDANLYSINIAPIIFRKVPDILITIIYNNVEYPLFLVEFSTAVFTEDHELQRFDGIIAAIKNNCVYIKISPLKKDSPSQHGGNTEFNYLIPYALVFKRYKKLAIHFEWECDENGVVRVQENYKSIPEQIQQFDELIKSGLNIILNNSYLEWDKKLAEYLKDKPFFKQWFKRLEDCKIPLLEESIGTNSTRIKLKNNSIELKINRFGHAMDPERGMAVYYSIYGNLILKMQFRVDNDAWYKDIPKENDIKEYINKHGLRSAYDYLYCFMLGAGLYNNDDFKGIVDRYKNSKNERLVIDLTDFVMNNFIKLNKSLRTIFGCSNVFLIQDSNDKTRVEFKWKDISNIDTKYSLPTTPLVKREELDEDDVTYICVHNIIIPNNYKILAVSYPGAQADRVVLIEYKKGKGRKQQRRYIDIIYYGDKDSFNKITGLQENKGGFTYKEIQKDINELSKYKTNKDYATALKSLKRYDENINLDIIKIGVGFWMERDFKISILKNIDLKELDYFIYVTKDRKEWIIWQCSNENIFRKMRGFVNLPPTYKIKRREISP